MNWGNGSNGAWRERKLVVGVYEMKTIKHALPFGIKWYPLHAKTNSSQPGRLKASRNAARQSFTWLQTQTDTVDSIIVSSSPQHTCVRGDCWKGLRDGNDTGCIIHHMGPKCVNKIAKNTKRWKSFPSSRNSAMPSQCGVRQPWRTGNVVLISRRFRLFFPKNPK